MKRYGIIDIGSNTEVLVIYEDDGTSFRTLQYISVPVHLIRYHRNGHMDDEGIRRTAETVAEFVRICREYGTDTITAEITEPWRRIDNADALTAAIEACGVPVMCLSGDEEALCSLAGARLAFDDVRLMIDIGGGSTEFVSIQDDTITDMVSIPYGCVRLQALGYDAEKAAPLVEETRRAHPLLQDCPVLTGVGGTLRAVEAFMVQYTDCTDGIPAEKLYELYEKVINGDADLLDLIYRSITEDRRPYIVPGLGMLVSICRSFHVNTVQVSPYGVREGFWMRHVRS
ncbi:MAG: hypothetical protein IKG46_03705 [Solobacterium sp.]|nr:hypothetical protein [Solobacterium sp.]